MNKKSDVSSDMKKIGIFINESFLHLIDMKDLGSEIRSFTGAELICSSDQVHVMPKDIRAAKPNEALDCLLVFGGDGTILSAIDFSIESSAPILGINSGKLGFLTDFSLYDFSRYIPRLFNGCKHKIIERLMLETCVKREGEIICSGFALNDAVIYKGLVSRLIDIKFYCSGKFVLETRCDGMIAATPTGSTAYSLSAGGPIISPEIEALIVAALCPHVLSVRPMVFSAVDSLTFKMAKIYSETMLQIDGKNVQGLIDGDLIKVKAAKQKVRFISLTGKSFYQTLRKKLHMGKI